MFDNKKMLSSLTLGLTISTASVGIHAQEEEPIADSGVLEELIVTGTAGGGQMRRIDATFAISTLDEDEIKRYGPATAADLTNAIPGVFTETAFGNAGAATRIRGLSVGDGNLASFLLNGAPVFPVNALEGIEHAGLIRYDDTIERVESVVTGTGAIFGQGQPGLTNNYVLKEGD